MKSNFYKTSLNDAEQLHLLRNIMIYMAEGLIVTNADLDEPGPIIILVNPAMCKLSGYSEEELLGQSPRMFHGPKTDKVSFKKMKNKLKKGEYVKYETINYKKTGEEYVVELHIAPILNSDGKITSYVSIQRDVTLKKKLQDKIDEHSKDLIVIASAAKTRTQELANGNVEL